MSDCVRRVTLFVGVFAMLCSASGIAGLAEGLDALKRQDFAAASKELRPLADRGDAEAQFRVGLMYEFGKGFSVDMPRAIAWLGKSAAQGHVAAQLELGVIYANGEGVPKDSTKAVAWFRKAAMQGNATGQYNLGLMYAKGSGVGLDIAQAIAWFRKAAEQGDTGALFKLGVAYENGEGVAKDNVLAYTNYAIAARNGNKEYAEFRDDIARKLSPSQARDAKTIADAWLPGKPLPGNGDVSGGTAVAANASPAPAANTPPAPDKCSATGQMEGQKFTATHCVASLYGDQHSVAIWFNEEPISQDETASYQLSSYADGAKGGKQRTLLAIMFCPGGGAATASASAVKNIDFNSNHAKSPLAGLQRSLTSPGDFKVEKLSGEVKPGGVLAGKIVGSVAKTSFNLEFSVTLPAKDAAAGLSCGK